MANRQPRDPMAQMQAAIAQLAANVTTLTNQVTATNNNVNAITQQLQANNQNAQPVVFALSPGLTDVDALIDYRTKHGAAVYQEAKAALPSVFSLKPSEVTLFENELESRAAASGWNSDAQGITKWNNSDGVAVNIIQEYGKIDMATLKPYCEAFITGNEANTRKAQNNRNASECLLASLDEDARKRVLAYRDEYTIEKQIAFPLLLKCLMRLATLDSTATDAALRANIRNCKVFAQECNWDVDKIISHIDDNFSQLKARGKAMDDAPQIILEMFSKANDNVFAKYFNNKLNDFWDQTDEMREISVENILAKAKVKYDLIKSQQKWGALSEEAEAIIALSAKVNEMSSANLKLTKQLKDRAKGGKKVGEVDGSKKVKRENGGKKTKNKKDNSNKKRQKADEAWMRVPPKAGEPETKEVNGKTWHWCIHHMCWTMHLAKDCRLGKDRASQQSNSTSSITNQATVANVAHIPESGFAAYASLIDSIRSNAAAAAE